MKLTLDHFGKGEKRHIEGARESHQVNQERKRWFERVDKVTSIKKLKIKR